MQKQFHLPGTAFNEGIKFKIKNEVYFPQKNSVILRVQRIRLFQY